MVHWCIASQVEAFLLSDSFIHTVSFSLYFCWGSANCVDGSTDSHAQHPTNVHYTCTVCKYCTRCDVMVLLLLSTVPTYTLIITISLFFINWGRNKNRLLYHYDCVSVIRDYNCTAWWNVLCCVVHDTLLHALVFANLLWQCCRLLMCCLFVVYVAGSCFVLASSSFPLELPYLYPHYIHATWTPASISVYSTFQQVHCVVVGACFVVVESTHAFGRLWMLFAVDRELMIMWINIFIVVPFACNERTYHNTVS